MQGSPAGSQPPQPLLTGKEGTQPLLNPRQSFLRPFGSKRAKDTIRQGLKVAYCRNRKRACVLVRRDDAVDYY